MLNGRIAPSMVDIKPQRFSDWLVSLEKEDISECGSVVKRSQSELSRMYASYWNFQHSSLVTIARHQLLNEARGEQ